MNEKVLSDDEVDALLEGVESGEVEVRSAAGAQLASVAAFDVPPRSRLTSKRLPRLEQLNERFAERLEARTQRVLQCDVGLECRDTSSASLESIPEWNVERIVAVQFTAAPLPGAGAILLEAGLVDQLVELYFGGSATESKDTRAGGFTFGELRIAEFYSRLALDTLKDLWAPLQALEPEAVRTESSLRLLDIAEEIDPVVESSFDVSFAALDGGDTALHLVMPAAMLEAQLPFFKGLDRKENPGQDRHWGETIRRALADIGIGVAATVGHATMTLGDVVRLEAGDVIPIENPRNAKISAQGVPLLAARFGVHAGRNAVEATRWLNDSH